MWVLLVMMGILLIVALVIWGILKAFHILHTWKLDKDVVTGGGYTVSYYHCKKCPKVLSVF